MICLDNTDTLEAGASVNTVVDYTVHGLVGTTFTMLADGQLSSTDPTVIYTAGAAISIVSIVFVNTHSAAVTINLYLDSANGGNPRRMIPKDVSLGIGYSLHFDGQRISVMDPTGGIAYTYIAHTHDGDTLQLDGVNSDGGAFPFTTSGLVTFSQDIAFAGQLGFPATQNSSADVNTLDDYEEYLAASTACTGALTVSISWKLVKIGNEVTLTVPVITGTTTNVANITCGVVLPAAYRPAENTGFCCHIWINGAGQAAPGLFFVSSTGSIRIYRDGTQSLGWGTAANSGMLSAASGSWVI